MSLTKITNGHANNLVRILGIYRNIQIFSKGQNLNLVGNICFTLCLTPDNLKSFVYYFIVEFSACGDKKIAN